jgi:4-azaleucine resistance transporter AzlC
MSSPIGSKASVDKPEDPKAFAALYGSVLTRFRRGLALGFPIFLGYLPVGMAFGILAGTTLGFTPLEAVLCSATALAGAGQFIALQFLQNGAGVVGVLVATTVVNLRYVLFGSTIATYIRETSLLTQAALAFSLTDETFAINIADHRQGLATPASMAGVGAIAWTGWVLGTLVGVIGASWIGDPARFGVGFAMPAMFTALFVALAEDWRHVVTGFAAGGIVLSLPLLSNLGLHVSDSWYLVIAAMTAATVATVVWRED